MISLSKSGKARFPSNLPWFMYDLYNHQLITSSAIPMDDIKDTKSVILTETPIPGRNFQPISPGGNGNRKVSFTLPIIDRTPGVGNVSQLKQFELLRNQSQGIAGYRAARGELKSNPKVLYYWGTGSVPLVWFVASISLRHVSNMVNAFGIPQASYVDIELVLDETDRLYKAEAAFRNYAAFLGESSGAASGIVQQLGLGAPF